MRPFNNRYGEDLQVMADLKGTSDHESLLKLRAKIDRMASQNIRQAALAIWQAKAKLSALDANSSA